LHAEPIPECRSVKSLLLFHFVYHQQLQPIDFLLFIDYTLHLTTSVTRLCYSTVYML